MHCIDCGKKMKETFCVDGDRTEIMYECKCGRRIQYDEWVIK